MQTLAQARSNVTQSIRDAGARVTQARVRVLQQLVVAPGPLSHAELEIALATDREPALDRVTLYRVLDDFVTLGLAMKSTDGRGVFRYAATTTTVRHDTHVHFRCTECGKVVCLPSIPVPSRPRLPKGFRLDRIEVDIRGACDRCARHAP